MGQGTLTIYSASAGSGKTFHLAVNYLAGLFRSRYQYRRILAVTFTNKATAEMKGRILDQLHNLASGEKSEYLSILIELTGKKEEKLRDEAREILTAILHDYTRFSVCTIDAFFQRIIRAFARESGLNSTFNIELDHTQILASAVDEMIRASSSDNTLSGWLIDYIMSNLGEEKSWNIREGILSLSGELFREKFKILSADEISNLENKEFLLSYIRKLKSQKSGFENKLVQLGKKGLEFISEYNLTDDMFYNRSRGVPGFIRSLASGKLTGLNDKVRAAVADPPRWSTGPVPKPLSDAIAGGLGSVIKSAIFQYDENIRNYKSINAILANIYALGILSDVLKKVHEVAFSSNTFLISDSAELLSLIIEGDQTPFIYEKTGSIYENFMIDEFQDTSVLQWKNFDPLIKNSMSEGHDNLVVGDIKQSIYRFRNSDWTILGKMLEREVDDQRFKSCSLSTNYRSASNIIRFNNTLFTVVPVLADNLFDDRPLLTKFKKLYSEAVQDDPGRCDGGYIRLELVGGIHAKENTDEPADETVNIEQTVAGGWSNLVLEKLPGLIETIENKGFRASDIGILVRDSREGSDVVRKIIEYSNDCPQEKKCRYDFSIISDDSVSLSGSNIVIFILSVLKVIDNQDDSVSRASMLRYFVMVSESVNPSEIPLFNEELLKTSSEHFPEGYADFLSTAGSMNLFEAVENIVSFFKLGNNPSDVPYLTAFQDIILNYGKNRNPDIHSFIQWWETSGGSKSLVLPSGQNAIRVLTIHKSKGLEFPVVILPFLSWNLDHKTTGQPILWVKPPVPFNDPGIVPVRYGAGLAETVFEDDYYEEKYSSYLDNINLLYVAMTRAVHAIYGFIPGASAQGKGIADILRQALMTDFIPEDSRCITPGKYFDNSKGLFEYGVLQPYKPDNRVKNEISLESYIVNKRPSSLRLKLRAGNYFLPGGASILERINYGQLMHEVFEGIDNSGDIPEVVRTKTLEGKIKESEAEALIAKLTELLSEPPVNEWFSSDNVLLKEAGILLPSGNIRRPDRIIFRDGKTTIIDFKFGAENPGYLTQIKRYQALLIEMGYSNIRGFIWYVDTNKIVNA